jgi:hypothetical protein
MVAVGTLADERVARMNILTRCWYVFVLDGGPKRAIQ